MWLGFRQECACAKMEGMRLWVRTAAAVAAIAFLSTDVVAAICFAGCERPLRGAADARACHEAAVPPVTASLTELPGCCHQIPGLDAAAVPVARSTTSSMFHWTTDLPGVTVPSPGLVASFDRSSRAAVEPPGPPQTSHVPMRL